MGRLNEMMYVALFKAKHFENVGAQDAIILFMNVRAPKYPEFNELKY